MPPGCAVCDSGLMLMIGTPVTAVPGRFTVPGVPWLTNPTEPPEVTGTTWPAPRLLTVDCQVTVTSDAPYASEPLHFTVSEFVPVDDLRRGAC